MTTEEKILETYKAFNNPETGFYAIRKKIQNYIKNTPDLYELYRENLEFMRARGMVANQNSAQGEHVRICSSAVFRIIAQYENDGTINKDNDELSAQEREIFETRVRVVVSKIVKNINDFLRSNTNKSIYDYLSNKGIELDRGEKYRFAFTPKQIKKYHFGYGCHHAAIGFINTNKELAPEYQIQGNCFQLIISTRYNNLLDGRCGHVVPCVKIQDRYYAFDPADIPESGKVHWITPSYTAGKSPEGRHIFHTLRGHIGVPYMITHDFVSPAEYGDFCGNHDVFIEQYSKVAPKKAFRFLWQQFRDGWLGIEDFINTLDSFVKYLDKAQNKQLQKERT